MSEGPRSANDFDFAVAAGDAFGVELIGPIRKSFDRGLERTDPFLARMISLVGDFTGRGVDALTRGARRFFDHELKPIRRILSAGGDVLVYTAVENGFSRSIVVDVFNPDARSALEMLASGGGGERQASTSPGYSRDWASSLRWRGAPVDIAGADSAAKDFATLFADALRQAATSVGGASGAFTASGSGSGLPFTANCNLKGYDLDFWPQYKYSPSRFGSVPTYPVHGTVPTSGNYYFQGRRGGAVKTDPSAHYAGGASSSTLVHLM